MRPDIEGVWRADKERRIKAFPQNNLRASSIGHPCDRFHFHSLKNWHEKPLHSAVLQSIFDEGNLHESAVLRMLSELGFQVQEQQRAFQIEKPLITGHVDGFLVHEGRRYPFDVKSIQDFDFKKINTAEDLLKSRKIHQRNYVAQVQMYLLQSCEEEGFLLFKSKQTGEIKTVWMKIDMAFCEELLQRAERVYAAAANNTPPARIDDVDMCGKCDFRHVCLPDLKYDAMVGMLAGDEIPEKLTRREELKPFIEEYETLDEDVKTVAKAAGKGEYACGDFIVRVKEQTRKTKVPITFDEKVSVVHVVNIVKIEV